MPIKIYTPSELSNEDYQALPQRSGSFLHALISHSPAKAVHGKIKNSKALDFGIWSHAMILENDRFNATYKRDFDPSLYEYILRKGEDYRAWLKERGIKVSGSSADLIQRILETGEPAHIEEIEREKYRSNFDGVEFITPADFDKIEEMRNVAMSDPEFAEMVKGGFPELSFVSDEFKCRPDLITSSKRIINYKTAGDASADTFSRASVSHGYGMRAVLECELFKAAYGEYPRSYELFVQEKDAPYICTSYTVYDDSRDDDEQPAAWIHGKHLLNIAIRAYRKCRDEKRWPGLVKRQDLGVSDWVMKQAGLA